MILAHIITMGEYLYEVSLKEERMTARDRGDIGLPRGSGAKPSCSALSPGQRDDKHEDMPRAWWHLAARSHRCARFFHSWS
jgi:hypothetical protein